MADISRGRSILMYLVMFVLMGLFVEVASTLVLYHRYHDYISEALQTRERSATGLLLKKMLGTRKGLKSNKETSSKPEPFRVPDSLHGYRIKPGSYEVTYRIPHFDTVQSFKHHVTVNDDGTRFVGSPPYPTDRDVYVFGDSFIFGEGVNDEQTFTYLLQSRFPNTRFHLYANPGHSLSNAYLNFQKISGRIGPEDVVILGYAQFYDVRHVAAPSRVKWWGDPHSHSSLDPKDFKRVRVRLVSDSLVFDRIGFFCAHLGDYCNQPDPSQGYMDSVTARLVNGIAKGTEAPVYLMHFQGPLRKEMTGQLDPRVRYIHAAPETFDFKYRDDVNGFDPHPGPYWNHAIYRRIADTLRTVGMK